MSFAPGTTTGSITGDILSQALLQTGVSTPIKLKTDGSCYSLSDHCKDNFLSCDVQTVANGFLPNIVETSNTSIHQNIFSPQNVMSFNPTAHGSHPPNGMYSQGVSHDKGTGSSAKDQYFQHINGSVGALPLQQQNSLVVNPIPLGTLSTNSQVGMSLSSCDLGGSGNLDMDLGDLLSINVDDPDIGVSMTQPVPASVSNYSVLVPASPQVPLQPPGPSTQYQNLCQPVLSQTSAQLPDLEDLDLSNILGDADPMFLNTLTTESFSKSSNTSYPHSSAPMQQMNGIRSFSQFESNSSGLTVLPHRSQLTATTLEQSSLRNLTVRLESQLPRDRGNHFVPPQLQAPSASFKPFKPGPVKSNTVLHPQLAASPAAIKQVRLCGNF